MSARPVLFRYLAFAAALTGGFALLATQGLAGNVRWELPRAAGVHKPSGLRIETRGQLLRLERPVPESDAEADDSQAKKNSDPNQSGEGGTAEASRGADGNAGMGQRGPLQDAQSKAGEADGAREGDAGAAANAEPIGFVVEAELGVNARVRREYWTYPTALRVASIDGEAVNRAETNASGEDASLANESTDDGATTAAPADLPPGPWSQEFPWLRGDANFVLTYDAKTIELLIFREGDLDAKLVFERE